MSLVSPPSLSSPARSNPFRDVRSAGVHWEALPFQSSVFSYQRSVDLFRESYYDSPSRRFLPATVDTRERNYIFLRLISKDASCKGNFEETSFEKRRERSRRAGNRRKERKRIEKMGIQTEDENRMTVIKKQLANTTPVSRFEFITRYLISRFASCF